ncbi:hypothetical protein BIV25_21175 [Streptomyces sp. MUSC 14]|uniref:hypothetical protein n=1 Tax=Streptomyces sp. MUSC 14 TaxID=1354889 RepID=UPI000916712C|nr:hypothetical protein [Streptomyces sp. MUSC 14]OIJ94904.1 hypothetical protein BIV25_21175 [Streptomyces sp. MUSC 14]
MSGDKRRRVSEILGMTGADRPGSRRAAAVDLALILAALVSAFLVCRVLGIGSWTGILTGGCAGAITTRLGLGARIARRRRD